MLESKAITREEYDTAFKTQIEIYDGLRSEEQYGQYFKEKCGASSSSNSATSVSSRAA